MQNPSLGRIVIVRERMGPEPAIVINVRSPTCVDVRLLGADPTCLTTGGATNVKKCLDFESQSDYKSINPGTWTWPARV